jgi:hypothetical protein
MAGRLDELYDWLAPDPNRQYSSYLPLSWDPRSNVVGKDQQFAMPGAVREGLTGILDLAKSTETGKLTGPALTSLLAGSGITGGLLGEAGALGSAPIRAYHGSPHSFERFDPSKIGTGEGAQAYGHGFYFAEKEGTARSYRDALSEPTPRFVSQDNRTFDVSNAPTGLYDLRGPSYSNTPYETLVRNAADRLDYANAVRNPRIREAETRKAQALVDWLKENPGVNYSLKPDVGHMYEVNIHADPKSFLNYDRPLSEQGDVGAAAMRVRQELARRDYEGRGLSPELTAEYLANAAKHDLSGQNIINTIKNNRLSAEGSEMLRQQGITGVRYLDQMSRGAGQGSSNYVVFPTQEEIIEILRKYGLSVPSPVAPSGGATPVRTPGLLGDVEDQRGLLTSQKVY